jgi:hypothetical protein
MDLGNMKPQVPQHIPGPSLGIPWTAVDPGKRVGSDYGSEGWGFESLRARPVMSHDIRIGPNPRLGFGLLFWAAGWGAAGLVVPGGVQG